VSNHRISYIASIDQEALTLEPRDQFNDAIIGYVEVAGQPLRVLYDRARVIAALMKSGMTHDDALEFFEFNIGSTWMGDGTPAFATLLDENGDPCE
jgi:hypothetical protein